MGTCYSTHASPINISTAEMPHDTSHTEAHSEKGSTLGQPVCSHFGFRKPYGGRYGKAANSNEQSSRTGAEVKRSPLGTVAESQHSSPNSEKSSAENIDNAPKRFGFGFKAPPAKRALVDSNKNSGVSEESLNSNSMADSSKRSSVKSNSKRPGCAYDPKDKHASLESWRMIDDSSTAESLSSGGDKLSRRADNAGTINEEDVKNANHSPENTPVSIKSVSSTSTLTERTSTNGVKPPVGSKLHSRLRGPLAKFYTSKSVDKHEKADNWVRASSTPPAEAKPTKASQSQQKKSGGGVPAFLRRGLLRKQKSAPAEPIVAKSSQKSTKKVRNQGVSTTTTANGDSHRLEDRVFTESTPKAARLPSKLTGAQRMFDIPSGKAPIAMIDSIETTSIGSINSDDLMLETDIPLDEYEELGPSEPNSRHQSTSDKPRSRKNSRTRSRSRSHSKDSLDERDTCRKVTAMQRSVSDTRANMARSDSFKKKSNKNVSADLPAENEPLQELASLLDKSNAVPRLVSYIGVEISRIHYTVSILCIAPMVTYLATVKYM